MLCCAVWCCAGCPRDSDVEKSKVGAIENEPRKEARVESGREGEERGAPPPGPDADERLDRPPTLSRETGQGWNTDDGPCIGGEVVLNTVLSSRSFLGRFGEPPGFHVCCVVDSHAGYYSDDQVRIIILCYISDAKRIWPGGHRCVSIFLRTEMSIHAYLGNHLVVQFT